MRIKINVTKRHINSSRKHLLGDCPIERAVKSLLKQDYGVRIGYTVGEITSSTSGEAEYYFKLSLAARNFAENFDKCSGGSQPFSFTTSIPEKYLK